MAASSPEVPSVNPLEASRQRALEQLTALLASHPEDPGLEARLVDLVVATVHLGTEGFHRRDPRAEADPRLDPSWIPPLDPETVDRLADAGLAVWDEEDRQWCWTNEWLAGNLGLRALRRGDAREAEEFLGAWLRNARTLGAQTALALLADEWIRDGELERLAPLFETEIGLSGLGGALALRAPAGAGDEIAAELEAYDALLDRLLGAPQALQPLPARFRSAKVVDRASGRLHGHPELRATRGRLLHRLVAALERCVEARPRNLTYLWAHARSLLGIARFESQPLRALEACRRALETWRRLREIDTSDERVRGFLHGACELLIALPREGDPALFGEVYALALEGLTRLPPDDATREKNLRQQVMLLGWTLSFEWDPTPGANLPIFERCHRLIDELLALLPEDEAYLEGKQQLLEEFAKYLDARDPERAAALRTESARIAEELAAAARSRAAVAPATGTPPPDTPAAAPPAGGAHDEKGPDLEALRAKIQTAVACESEDPHRAIALAKEIVEAICRGVLVREMGPPPGHPTFSQVRSWIVASGRLPERLHYGFEILEWHADLTREDLGRVPLAGAAPGVACRAIMARFARWYFGEHLGVEPPPEVAEEPAAESPSPPEPDRPRLVAVGARGSKGSRPSRAERRRELQVASERPAADTVEPGFDPLEIRLHPTQTEAARRLGVAPTIEDPRTGMVMVLIPGGAYRWWRQSAAGESRTSSPPPSWVEVRIRPFYCGVAPVLQEEWSRAMDRNPSPHVGARLPVTNVGWQGALAFLARVNQDRSGPPLRLPLEPEWEPAARGGTTTEYWWGDDYRPGWTNCSEAGSGSGLQQPSAPGRFPPNPFGLYDVLGNVHEWCHGARLPDPVAPTPLLAYRTPVADDRELICGGSWQSQPPWFRRGRRVSVREGCRVGQGSASPPPDAELTQVCGRASLTAIADSTESARCADGRSEPAARGRGAAFGSPARAPACATRPSAAETGSPPFRAARCSLLRARFRSIPPVRGGLYRLGRNW